MEKEQLRFNFKNAENINKVINDDNRLVDFSVGINNIKLTFYDNKSVSELDFFINNEGRLETNYNSEVKEFDYNQKEKEYKEFCELMSNSIPSFDESLEELSDDELMSLIDKEEEEEDDYIKAYDEWEASATPEELKEAFEASKRRTDEYHLSKEYEIEDYKLLEAAKAGYTNQLKDALFVMGYKVSDINLFDQKEIYLLAQKNSAKLIIMGGLYEKSKITWTEKILNVSNLMKQNKAITGTIVTNRPADIDSIILGHENGVAMIHEYYREDIAREFFDILYEYEIFQREERIDDDWYLHVNKEYLSRFFNSLGYKVRTVKVIGDLEEIGWDMLINEKSEYTVVKTAFNRSQQNDEIIKEVILANKYYNTSEDYDGFYEGGIIISNVPFSKSEMEMAKTNHIRTISAKSLDDMIWKLLHVYD